MVQQENTHLLNSLTSLFYYHVIYLPTFFLITFSTLSHPLHPPNNNQNLFDPKRRISNLYILPIDYSEFYNGVKRINAFDRFRFH